MKKNKIEDFKVPEWMDCTWRRIPCGKPTCKICGRIMEDKARSIVNGESFDDLVDGVEKSLGDILALLKKGAKLKGVNIEEEINSKNPPKPYDFPFYKRVSMWRNGVYKILDDIIEDNEFMYNDGNFADIAWYTDTLMAKVYRQLTNSWYIKIGDRLGRLDYDYNAYVLHECISIIEKSMGGLIDKDIEQKNKLMLAFVYLSGIRGDILEL